VDEHIHGKNHRTRKGASTNKQNHKKQSKNQPNPTPRGEPSNPFGGRRPTGKVTQNEDLHPKSLHDAKNTIKEVIKNLNGKGGVQFIHGHNHGTVIRNWIRGGGLRQYLDSDAITTPAKIWFNAPGDTCVSFE
jgi:hypothetical protein